jgi:hypothetical protein
MHSGKARRRRWRRLPGEAKAGQEMDEAMHSGKAWSEAKHRGVQAELMAPGEMTRGTGF